MSQVILLMWLSKNPTEESCPNVHSSFEHEQNEIEIAKRQGLKRCYSTSNTETVDKKDSHRNNSQAYIVWTQQPAHLINDSLNKRLCTQILELWLRLEFLSCSSFLILIPLLFILWFMSLVFGCKKINALSHWNSLIDLAAVLNVQVLKTAQYMENW